MFCSKCGKEVGEARFCGTCGTPLKRFTEPRQVYKSRVPNWVAALFVIVFVAAVTGIFHLSQKGLETTGSEMNNSETANSEMTNSETASSEPQAQTQSDQDIRDFVNSWIRAIEQKDIEKHMTYYADKIDKYYTRYNVPKTDIYQDKSRINSKYDSMVFEISNINISNYGSTAEVTFNKKWDARGTETFSGEVLQKLDLNQINGNWLIVGEEELRIYWVIRNGKKIK